MSLFLELSLEPFLNLIRAITGWFEVVQTSYKFDGPILNLTNPFNISTYSLTNSAVF